MRGLKRQRQTIYWSRITERLDGIDTVPVYEKPKKLLMSVSATAGTSEEIASGYVPGYDRYITCFDRTFQPKEADVFWVDKIPELDVDGNLIPTVLPDYRLTKILDTSKGNVARYGISKIGADNE